jgi:hypothetical protein
MNDFDNLRDDDFGFDDTSLASSPSLDDSPDEFDQLRRSSARSETMFNDLATEETSTKSSGSSFSLSNFSPGQRLVLAILVVLDILVVGVALLVVLGAI